MEDEINNKPIVPPGPWSKGDQGMYSMAVVEVEVCRDAFGRVFSNHHPQEDADKDLVLTWPSGGQEQIAFALLAEASRREALLVMLVQMTKDKAFLSKMLALPEAEREKRMQDMAKALRMQMNRTVARIAEDVIREAFHNVTR